VSLVALVSGGLDSALMTLLAVEEGIEVHPLFINYGQKAAARELKACRAVFRARDLPKPTVMNVAGFGRLIESGLTSDRQDTFLDAFLPGRNLLFLLLGAAYAYQVGAGAVAIGLLTEKTSLFPDQTAAFTRQAERLLTRTLGRPIAVLTPLMGMHKAGVVELSHAKGLSGTYSCHQGGPEPCGRCVACREYLGTEEG
jgi:7-cyano-7-deazaguanine synthase